jgi:hypothetical protein
VNASRVTCPAAVVIVLAVVTALAACSGSPAASMAARTGNSLAAGGTPAAEPGLTTFICTGSTSATLLQWTASNDGLSGTYEYSSIGSQAPQEQVSSNSGSLSGTLNGNTITLDIGFQQSLYGTLDGGS